MQTLGVSRLVRHRPAPENEVHLCGWTLQLLAQHMAGIFLHRLEDMRFERIDSRVVALKQVFLGLEAALGRRTGGIIGFGRRDLRHQRGELLVDLLHAVQMTVQYGGGKNGNQPVGHAEPFGVVGAG